MRQTFVRSLPVKSQDIPGLQGSGITIGLCELPENSY